MRVRAIKELALYLKETNLIQVINMDIKFTKDTIEFEKEFSSLDNFALDFVSILDRVGIKYVVISGYVSILFGRNRTSEDIDLIAQKTDFAKFSALWNEISKEFECVNASAKEDAYKGYLLTGHALRFSRKGEFIPNIEFKFPKAELDFWTLNNSKKVIVNHKSILISPLELQIPFKLFLGSEKDIEDARHLYGLFKGKINTNLMMEFCRKLKVEGAFRRYLP